MTIGLIGKLCGCIDGKLFFSSEKAMLRHAPICDEVSHVVTAAVHLSDLLGSDLISFKLSPFRRSLIPQVTLA